MKWEIGLIFGLCFALTVTLISLIKSNMKLQRHITDLALQKQVLRSELDYQKQKQTRLQNTNAEFARMPKFPDIAKVLHDDK